MKTIKNYVLIGAASAAAAAATPLYLQHREFANLNSAFHAHGHYFTSRAFYREQATKDPENSFQTQLRVAEAVQKLSTTECIIALESARESTEDNNFLISVLMTRWASLDGGAAFRWLAQQPYIFDRVIADAGPAWAASDPAGFARWLNDHALTQKWGNEFDSYSYCKWLAPYDLPAAVRIAMKIARHSVTYYPTTGQNPADVLRISKLDLMPYIRSAKDAQLLAKEIEKHPEWIIPVTQDQIAHRAFGDLNSPIQLLCVLRLCWQEVDYSGWKHWSESHPKFAKLSGEGPTDVASAMLFSSNREVDANIFLCDAPLAQQDEVMKNLVETWGKLDPRATEVWLRTLQEGQAKWEGMQVFCIIAAGDDPSAALQWTDNISNLAQRNRARRRVFTKWYTSDSTAAAAWLTNCNWSEYEIFEARCIMTSIK